MYAPGIFAHHVTIFVIYQRRGYATHPHRIASGSKSNPVALMTIPRKMSVLSRGTVSILAIGAIKEIVSKVTAKMGSVATCAASVTAMISVIK
jgi:hypothetical protein